jgi:hypothetical protein
MAQCKMTPRSKQSNESTAMRRQQWNGTSIEFKRPTKRVRISCEDPAVAYPGEIPGKSNTSSCQESQPQRHRTWLNREELCYIRSCARKLCRQKQLDDILQNVNFQAGSSDSSEKCSYMADLADNDDFVEQRGLERWCSLQHSILRSVKIVEVRTAVFLEQASQMMSGRKDPDLIAKVTREASKSSRSLAQYMASADAMVAMQVRKEYRQEQAASSVPQSRCN